MTTVAGQAYASGNRRSTTPDDDRLLARRLSFYLARFCLGTKIGRDLQRGVTRPLLESRCA
jgi:hypothetical protein